MHAPGHITGNRSGVQPDGIAEALRARSQPTGGWYVLQPERGWDGVRAQSKTRSSVAEGRQTTPASKGRTPERQFLILTRKVELKGFEPLTPCLQSRCSPN